MSLKTTGAVIALSAVILLLGSCPEPGNTISFWVMPNTEGPEHSAWFEAKKGEFFKREGIIVNIETVTWADSWTKIRDSLAHHRVPDVIQLRSSWTAFFASSGDLAEMNPRDYGGAEAFAAVLLDQAAYRGKYYGIPWFGETYALVYRRNALTALKADAPSSLQELHDIGKKTTARLGKGRALALPGLYSGRLLDIWSLFLYGEGGRYVSPDGNTAAFGSEAGIRAAERYLALYREGLADALSFTAEAGEEERLIASGKAVFGFLTAAGLRRVRKSASDAELAAIAPPPGPAGDGVSVIGSNLVIPDQSPHKRKAARWISFLLDEKNLVDYTHGVCAVLPASRKALADAVFREKEWPAFTKGLARAIPYPALASWMTVEKEASDALKLILLASTSKRRSREMTADILAKAAQKADRGLGREAAEKTRP